MKDNMIKITIPLPEDNLAAPATESVWAERQVDGTYKVKNVPFYAKGISCEDIVEAEPQDRALVFKRVVRHNGHSTYRIYAANGRTAPEVVSLVGRLQQLHCDIEPATDTLVGVDVLPEADIYKVYETLAVLNVTRRSTFRKGIAGIRCGPKPKIHVVGHPLPKLFTK